MVYTVDMFYTVDPAELFGTPINGLQTTVMNIAIVGNDKFWEL